MTNRHKSGEFMQLPYVVKTFGTTGKTQTTSTLWKRKSTNALLSTYSNNFGGGHVRNFPSVNRRRPLPGTSTPWIPPSVYERKSFDWVLTAPEKYQSNNVLADWYLEGSLVYTAISNSYVGKASQTNPMYTNLGPYPNNFNGDYQNAVNRARTEALVDFADSKAGLGEDLAQAVKTADLLFDTAIAIAKVARAVKQGKLWELHRHFNAKEMKEAAKSGKIPKKLAGQWLAYQYAWKPMALTAYGLYELLLEQLAPPALLVHGRGQGRAPDYENDWAGAEPGVPWPPCIFKESSKLSVRCQITGKLNAQEYLRTLNRVGLVNPVSLAWDLLPFSFVVDWVLPLGDVAFALSAPVGTSFVGGHQVIRYQRLINVELDSKYAYGGSTPQALFRSSGMMRTVLSTYPRPVPYVKSPFMGGERIATIIALITALKR